MVDSLYRDLITIIKRDGSPLRSGIPASVQRGKIFIKDSQISIERDDHILRELPNGMVEDYVVEDPNYINAGSISHWEIKVRRGNAAPTAAQTIINKISGNFFSGNTKISQGFADYSTTHMTSVSTQNDAKLFTDLAAAVLAGVSEDNRRQEILKEVDRMRTANGKDGFIEAYRKFMSSASDHMTVIGPFVPALSQLL